MAMARFISNERKRRSFYAVAAAAHYCTVYLLLFSRPVKVSLRFAVFLPPRISMGTWLYRRK